MQPPQPRLVVSLNRTDSQIRDMTEVTTYSSLFNTNPFFDNADVLIVDDAHAAEGYISRCWSLRVQRDKPKHSVLHAALCGVIKPIINPLNFTRLSGQWSQVRRNLQSNVAKTSERLH